MEPQMPCGAPGRPLPSRRLARALLVLAGWSLAAAVFAQPASESAASAASPAASSALPLPAASAPASAAAPLSRPAAASAATDARPATGPAAASAPRRKAAAPLNEGPRWSALSPAQRTALRPLQRDWAEIDALRKQKWLEIAQRFDKLTPTERARLHERMAEWARMSPQQRSNARLTFQEAQQLPPEVRQDRWAAYLALPEPDRLQFIEQAGRSLEAPARPAPRPAKRPPSSLAKSSIVPNPLHATPPRAAGPALLRAAPGATTTPLRQPPQPPRHLVPGLPKIAAIPEFVDGTTLAPRVGPQAPGTRPPERESSR
ncbi:DUF3106 domain-containing protein [Caldimonas tepidiphila]|uniref:DUF3106 domain-containing protein n=1 Tax=Caldimonas tepidiphila TaxID=2315841 RepID=UPI000E5B7D07|nr:DUF3106 domain-containing protein [Caldimonas tepidiphila]